MSASAPSPLDVPNDETPAGPDAELATLDWHARLQAGLEVIEAAVDVSFTALIWTRPGSRLFSEADVVGDHALIMPLFDSDGAHMDDLAVKPGVPDNWWLRRGEAVLAAPWLFHRARLYDTPLKLVRTATDWLSDMRNTACILRPEAFDFVAAVQDLRFAVDQPTHVWLGARATAQLLARFAEKSRTHGPA
jgi:hypothetical protein